MAHKIIAVTGPREGVGKTTLLVNLAARYAQARHQPVLLLDTDPNCRGETAQFAGAQPTHTILQILDQLTSKQASVSMLRGRIPVNRMGLACLPLASNARESERLAPEQWVYFLQAFSQIYDLMIDIEASNAFRTISMDMADAVVWTFLPNTLSLRSTIQNLDALQSQKFSFERFIFTLNQAGIPHSLSDDTMGNALDRFGKQVDAGIPFDSEILGLLNQGRPVILENARSPYYQSLSPVLDRILRYQREGQTAHILPAAMTVSSGKAGGSGAAILENTLVDKMISDKRKRWDSVKQKLHRELVEELNIRRIDLDTKGDPTKERQLRTNVESTVNALIAKEKELPLVREEREQLVKELVDEALGLGPLEELLRDPTITEIMVNRFDQVYIERKGKILLTDKRFIDNNHIIQVIRRIIAPLGRRIDESVPMVDARLRDGSRVNAIIPPLAVQGPTLTIRRFPEKAYSADDLIRIGSISPEMVEFLKVCVLMKRNVLISGGTGTGKTTVLNMLSGYIPDDERIVTVEDTAELRMQQEHVVRLEARPANIEGQGMVTIRDLVRNSLRMRPDRIVVGECRGGEALDMLQAMNTGHDGSLTTIHANSPRDAFTRLETLCLMAGMDLPVWALREQIRSAIHIIIQLSRLQDGSRRITCITEIVGRTEEAITTQDLFRFVQDSVDAQGQVVGHHEPTGARPSFAPELKNKGFALDPKIFGANGD